MKNLILLFAVVFLSGCCATNEFIETEKTDASNNYSAIKNKTPLYIEKETSEVDKKIRDWTVRVNEHGRDHSHKFWTRLSNFVERESLKATELSHCD
ncbi:hypothetical protein PQO03_10465 [Lentisphaera profundi]|uniref:Lipoprotein n=1 Tax=Lentisphaera profundi TaxID=1658616 RepID=A0ABY7VQM1_9BACT|nr:hypothetical protein [Lentisphaera profundi]WDE96136.1 hypothetical protein PQO03_10465 [Lentisphaera profundi]